MIGRWKMEKANLGKAGAYVTEGRKREERKSTLWWPSLNSHLASNVQEGGLRARNEVRGALHLPSLGPLLFWVVIQEVRGRSTNKCGEGVIHMGKFAYQKVAGARRNTIKIPDYTMSPPSCLKQQTRLANISHVSPSYWLWTNYLLTFPSSWKPA